MSESDVKKVAPVVIRGRAMDSREPLAMTPVKSDNTFQKGLEPVAMTPVITTQRPVTGTQTPSGGATNEVAPVVPPQASSDQGE